MTRTDELRRLADRTEVSETVSRYLRAIDRHDWGLLRKTLAETIRVDFGTLFDAPPATHALDAFVGFASRTLGGFSASQHIATDRIVTIDGDRGALDSNVQAWVTVEMPSHLEDTFALRGRYAYELERTAAGWRIDAIELTVVDVQGNKGLYDVAATRGGA